MKRNSLMILLLLAATLVNAQSSKVNSAYASYTHAEAELAAGDIDAAINSLSEAAEYIEPALSNGKNNV